jgi:DNA-binding LacI/PurR family transcriptional regulator
MTRKKTTINDVAAAAGVTKSTVSLVLSGKGNISVATSQTVRRVAKRLNYEPNPYAQHLSSGRRHNTVALFSLSMDLGVGTLKTQLMQKLLAEQGYEIPTCIYGGAVFGKVDEIEPLKMLRRQNPLAIICNVTPDLPEQALIELRRYREEGGVVVTYDFHSEFDCDRVIFDREDNTYQTTRHLLELGHRDIGLYMAGAVGPAGPRLQGFYRAHREFGVVPRTEWLFGSTTQEIPSYLHEEAGAQLAAVLLKLKSRPTGMCIVNDSTAMACISQLQRAGWRVPEDMSIVGHDDAPIARYGCLPLTTTKHPVEAIANQVVDLLADRLRLGAETPPREVVIRGNLVVRQSAISHVIS